MALTVQKLNDIGYGIIIPVGLVLNLAIILTFILSHNHMKLRHLMLFSLAVADALCIVLFAFELWGQLDDFCMATGYAVCVCALASLTHLVVLAIERMMFISFPFKSQVWFTSKKVVGFLIGACWSYGILWASFPLIGWGEYWRESERRCSIRLTGGGWNVRTYNFCLLFFCYVVPVSIALLCLLRVKGEMKQILSSAVRRTGMRSRLSLHTTRQEKSMTTMYMVMLVAFLLAWTPYSACIFATEINGYVPPALLNFSAFMGKSSTLFNPIIYFFMFKELREKVSRMLQCILLSKQMKDEFENTITSV